MTSISLRILTGITTSGTPHLGNYVGAIRPAIEAARAPGVESFYFLADYHALVKVSDPARVQRSTLEIAAAWLACGLDPETVWFYRQSDIPEIPELTWLLTCVAGKGLLNRAHAYKAAVDGNRAGGEDDDAGINAGLYLYPVLMAADILLFNAHKVPVGRDQVQHIEMARDIAQRFNHLYGAVTGDTYFVLPEAQIETRVATLPGVDGRKMSKSYDNTIPLFAPRAELERAIKSIVTDSRAPGEPKDADTSNVFALYQAFASSEDTEQLRADFAAGIGWGEAKQRLSQRIEAEIAPLRERYLELMQHPDRIEAHLCDGAARLRAQRAQSAMARLREAVGLRALDAGNVTTATGKAAPETVVCAASVTPEPMFKQYRERDGRFYFKLLDSEGQLLLQSPAYDSPQAAAAAITALKSGEPLPGLPESVQPAVRAALALVPPA